MKNIFQKVIAAMGLGVCFFYWQNNGLMVSKIAVVNAKIPESFDGYKILQISDLQNKTFGKKQCKLIQAVENAASDMIVITGDLIDANRTDIEAAMDLIRRIVYYAPVYYVSGNHDYRAGVYEDLVTLLEAEGVVVLDNDVTLLERGGEKIDLVGLADIRVNKNYSFVLHKLAQKRSHEFSILLSHRPEIFDLYYREKFDLIFTGHAHGGQIRLPFIGGLFAPNQGFLPQYTKGIYQKGNSSLIVSRGLGNSKFPFRINNRPELVEVTLYSK